jgi:hypothetical protein
MLRQFIMGAQAVGQEEDLRMKRPTIHVGIEIGKVGVFGHRFVERFPIHLPA